ncbi:MAG TPA: enoyl-CoA hydratase-related protein [Candidatus Binataceae bacterium]|jgi:enoyl-CoA hydratase/carnithine racemase|nr:enoyl-CoA hydratase-related protein [Candidatus Binataceae bacterium]
MDSYYKGLETILVSKDNGVATITLNRPEARNAVSPRMHSELSEMWPRISADPEIDAIILTGAGKAFCAGGDVKGMDAGAFKHRGSMTTEARLLITTLLDVEQPIIAAINGDAIGLGATIGLFCDITVAAETARIADPHVRVGLVAGDGGAVIWPHLIGPNRAKEFLMRGNMINATEAARLGLVNYAVPAADVMKKANELARELADGPRWAIRWTKVSVNKTLKESVNLVLDTSLAFEEVTMKMPDHLEAARAFVEKRKPVFNKD